MLGFIGVVMKTKHIAGIFMCIKQKGKEETGNSRIYVLEIPSGKFFDGLLETKTVRGLQLRDSISVDLADVHVVDAGEVCHSGNYTKPPKEHFRNKVDKSLI